MTPEEFDRELVATTARSIANLRRAADHRRVEQLARQIHATLAGESQANALLAQTKVLGNWLLSMSAEEAVTAISMIAKLITNEITRGSD